MDPRPRSHGCILTRRAVLRPRRRRHRHRRPGHAARPGRSAAATPTRRPAGPAALRPQGQARHLPDAGRRAVARRSVRLQARAGEAARPGAARARCTSGQRLTTMTAGQKSKPVLPGITGFKQYGKSGATGCATSCRTPAAIADELCFIKSMHTEAINHAPAMTFFLTGAELPGRPSIGAWLVLRPGQPQREPADVRRHDLARQGGVVRPDLLRLLLGQRLPAVEVPGREASAPSGDPVLYLSNPPGMSRDVRRGLLDDLAELNEIEAAGDRRPGDRHAHRPVRDGLPHADERARADRPVDASRSTSSTCTAPTCTGPAPSPATACWPGGWPSAACATSSSSTPAGTSTATCRRSSKIQCRDTDQPSAALVQDLKQRGLLDDTLVIWGGEFGRTPFVPGRHQRPKQYGRDHHPRCFTIWMAGGGIKPGMTYGETDDFGYNVAKDPVHVHDFQATHAAPAGHRPHAADVQVPGPALPADRRATARWSGRSWRDRKGVCPTRKGTSCRSRNILAFLKKRPFIPIRLHLSDGRSFDIHHPELVMPGRLSIIVGIPA